MSTVIKTRKPFKFPRPQKARNASSNLAFMPFVQLRIISLLSDSKTYLAFIGTCRMIRKLGDDKSLISNHARDVSYILSLIFDHKRNVFITGPGGTGKTFILNKIYDWSLKLNIRATMTATTGIASINLTNGRTAHSFSGLRKGTIPLDKLQERIALREFKCPKIWNETDLLVCDEISMNGARFLSKLDAVGKFARMSNKPLGGLPVVFSGDFSQLAPVADKFPFTSPIWKELDLVPVCLHFPFRQNQDMTYYRFLQRIRMGEPTEADYEFLEDKLEHTLKNLKVIDEMDIKPTRLLSKQKAVQKINHDEFSKLLTPIEHTLVAEDDVVERVVQGKKVSYVSSTAMTLVDARVNLRSRAEYQAPEQIQFRESAQYILTINISLKKKHVNGSKCAYRSDDGGKLEFIDKSTLKLDECKRMFYYSVGGNIFIKRWQVALRLGYAASVHSAQGSTLDKVMVDLGPSIFCSAQAYVALSRCRSADGLYIDNFVRKSIKTHAEAKKYMKKIESMTERLSLNDLESEDESSSDDSD